MMVTYTEHVMKHFEKNAIRTGLELIYQCAYQTRDVDFGITIL